MDKKECRKRSLAAEARGDAAAALYWSRRETGSEPLPCRVIFSGSWRPENQPVTSRKQMARIIRNLLTPMGAQ
jgi:hypothetical protein